MALGALPGAARLVVGRLLPQPPEGLDDLLAAPVAQCLLCGLATRGAAVRAVVVRKHEVSLAHDPQG